jgi:hypothetical protein
MPFRRVHTVGRKALALRGVGKGLHLPLVTDRYLAGLSPGQSLTEDSAVPLEASFTASAVSATDTSSPLTFSGVALGVAAADRRIIVVASVSTSTSSSSISGVTVGGQTGVQLVAGDNNNRFCSIFTALVPTGTTGDIVVSISAQTGETWGIGVFRLTGAAEAATDTAVSAADPSVLTIDCPAGGVIIGGAFSAGVSAWTWAEITEAYDENAEGTIYHSGAFDKFAVAQTNLAVTATADTPDGPVSAAVAIAQG